MILTLLSASLMIFSGCWTVQPAVPSTEIQLEPIPATPVTVNVTPLMITFPTPPTYPESIIFYSVRDPIPEDGTWLTMDSAKDLLIYLSEVDTYISKIQEISNYQEEVLTEP